MSAVESVVVCYETSWLVSGLIVAQFVPVDVAVVEVAVVEVAAGNLIFYALAYYEAHQAEPFALLLIAQLGLLLD